MADTIASSFKTWIESLTATNDIVDSFGDTFTYGTNLFIGIEEDVDNCITIIPYGGSPPSKEGDRQNPALQILVKSTNRKNAIETSQAFINELHNNKSVCTGRIEARDSSPIPLGIREGGRSVIYVTNYLVKHVKL